MTLKSDVIEMKEEVETMKKEKKDNSFAMELLNSMKASNKRLFTIIIVILTMWFITIGYLVYILNDVGVITNEQTIDNIDTIENSTIKNGD